MFFDIYIKLICTNTSGIFSRCCKWLNIPAVFRLADDSSDIPWFFSISRPGKAQIRWAGLQVGPPGTMMKLNQYFSLFGFKQNDLQYSGIGSILVPGVSRGEDRPNWWRFVACFSCGSRKSRALFLFPQQTHLLSAGSLLYFTREIKRQQQHVLRADTKKTSAAFHAETNPWPQGDSSDEGKSGRLRETVSSRCLSHINRYCDFYLFI